MQVGFYKISKFWIRLADLIGEEFITGKRYLLQVRGTANLEYKGVTTIVEYV